MHKTAMALGCAAILSACMNSETEQGAATVAWTTLSGEPPIIITHRGASAYLPGHTLEAYELGID